MKTFKLVRPLSDVPVITVTEDDLIDWYMCSSGFVTADKYSANTMPEPGEAGYQMMSHPDPSGESAGLIYPIVRITVKATLVGSERKGEDSEGA